MIPERIALKGFLSYDRDEQVITFDGGSLWLLSGPNGSGKSSVFDAMTFALFGAYRGGKQDLHEAINKSCDEASVEFDFRLDGKSYRIRRTLKRKKGGGATAAQQVFQLAPGSDGAAAKYDAVPDTSRKSELDRWVGENVGLSYDSFTTSVLLVQGKADALLTADPRDRHQVLARIIGMEDYERLHGRVAGQARGFDARADALQTQLDGIAEVSEVAILLAEEAIEKAETAIQKAKAEVDRLELLVERSGALASAWQLLNTLQEQREKLRQAHEAIRQANEKEAAATELVAKYGDRLQAMEGALDEAGKGAENARDQDKKKEALLEEMQKRHERFFSVVGQQRCRYCGQELTPSHVEMERAKLDKELQEASKLSQQAMGDYRGVLSAKNDLEAEYNKTATLRDTNERAARDHRSKREREEAISKGAITACTTAYKGLPETFRLQVSPALPDDWTSTVFPTEDDLARIAQEMAQAAQGGFAGLERELADARRGEKDCPAHLLDAKTAWQRLHDAKGQREKLAEERATAVKNAGLYGVLADALGPDKLQRYVMRHAEQTIVCSAGQILDRLSGGKLALRLKSDEQTGRDKKALVLEAIKQDAVGQQVHPVDMLSGSERFRVAVSLALAIGEYAGRQHRPIQSVIIDEGFGCLDPANSHLMIQELHNLQGQLLKQIVLVSHQDEFASAFTNGYRFRLENGGTRVRREPE